MIRTLLQVKGSWRQRVGIYALTFFLAILFMWVLQFVLDDIRGLKSPEWATFEKQYLSSDLVQQQKNLKQAIDDKNLQINQLNQQRAALQKSTESTELSIKQINEQQKLLLQHNQALSPSEIEFKNKNLLLFQSNQAQDQTLAQALINKTNEQQSLVVSLKKIEARLDEQRKPAKTAYDKAVEKQRLIEAVMQMAFLMLMLGLSMLLLVKYKNSLYKMPLLAFFIAVVYKIFFVLYDYFSIEYFKYILIAALIIVLAKILLSLVRNTTSSKPEVLLKRYQDAYTHFLCPNCEFPIRRGPMKYLYWTRRSVSKIIVTRTLEPETLDEAYTCPLCSTPLFSPCEHCKAMKYHLLPTCQHCGCNAQK